MVGIIGGPGGLERFFPDRVTDWFTINYRPSARRRVTFSATSLAHMHKVFIDGQAGTTGLEIASRIKSRGDIELLEISEAERKQAASRRAYFDAADLAILCLPDAAAQEAVALAPSARILDASTAHRTADGLGVRTAGTRSARRAMRSGTRSASAIPAAIRRGSSCCCGRSSMPASSIRRASASGQRGVGILGRGQDDDRRVLRAG